MRSTRVSFREHVDPKAVKSLVKRILDATRVQNEIQAAAAIHDHIREQVNYDETVDPGFNRHPVEAYKKGGNCVDIAILQCSLYSAVGLSSKLIALKGDESDHMTAAVGFSMKPSDVTDELASYRRESGDLGTFTFSWFRDGFFVSDHKSRYVGDSEPLSEFCDSSGRFTIRESIRV